MLFVDYIKFSHQSFDCYIFYFNFFYFILKNLIKFDFYINFGPDYFDYYLFLSYYLL